MARITGCNSSSLPFTYLGPPVGLNMHLSVSWTPIIDKVRKRLSSWKAKLLSIGGRLTLIKSVLGSLGIFYMSLFKAPLKVLKYLEALRSSFFWGGNGEDRKIHWAKWNLILNSKENGGLGVNSLHSFNLALIYKWRWRYVHSHDSLWVNVLKAVHGHQPNGLHPPVKANYGGVWATINRSIDSLHHSQIIPSLSMSLKLANERYFNGDWNWQWRRNPRDGAESFQHSALMNAMGNVSFNEETDKWIWNADNSHVFSVSSARRLIDNANLLSGNPTKWNKFVPTKINIFAWRLLMNRLPTKMNLNDRDIDVAPHAIRLKRMLLISSFTVRWHPEFDSKLLSGQAFRFLNGLSLMIGLGSQTLN